MSFLTRGKEELMFDCVDNREELSELFRAMYGELPLAKKKQ